MDRKQIINDPSFGNKAEAFEAFDDIPTNPNLQATIGDVIHARYGRRGFMQGALAVTASTALFGSSALVAPRQANAASHGSRYIFDELSWAMTKHTTLLTGTMPIFYCAGATRSRRMRRISM